MSLHTDFLCSVPKIYIPPLNIRTCSTRHKTIQVTIFLYILRKRPPTPTKKMLHDKISLRRNTVHNLCILSV